MAIDCLSLARLEVRLIDDERQLESVAEAWNGLAQGVPFREREWLATWWCHFRRPGDKLFMPAIYDFDGQLVGLAPWYVSRDRWPGRVVRFLGSGRVCSEYLTVLAAPAAEQRVLHRLAVWLTTEAAARWDLLDFDGISGEDCLLAQLADELSHAGHIVYRRARQRTWRLKLAPTWDEFLGGLSKSRRGKIRAQERRFLESGRATVRVAEDLATLRQGLEILHRLHQARRASLGDDGCFTLLAFERFLEDAAARLLRTDQLRLQWLEIDGQPAAVELDLLGDDTLYYYQSGMNPDLAELSPGWLLQIASLKQAIADGRGYFDFLRGDEAYKSTWGAQPRSLAQFRIPAKRPLARLRHELWLAGVKGKNRWATTKKWAAEKKFSGGDQRKPNIGDRPPPSRQDEPVSAGAET